MFCGCFGRFFRVSLLIVSYFIDLFCRRCRSWNRTSATASYNDIHTGWLRREILKKETKISTFVLLNEKHQQLIFMICLKLRKYMFHYSQKLKLFAKICPAILEQRAKQKPVFGFQALFEFRIKISNPNAFLI